MLVGPWNTYCTFANYVLAIVFGGSVVTLLTASRYRNCVSMRKIVYQCLEVLQTVSEYALSLFYQFCHHVIRKSIESLDRGFGQGREGGGDEQVNCPLAHLSPFQFRKFIHSSQSYRFPPSHNIVMVMPRLYALANCMRLF